MIQITGGSMNLHRAVIKALLQIPPESAFCSLVVTTKPNRVDLPAFVEDAARFDFSDLILPELPEIDVKAEKRTKEPFYLKFVREKRR